MVCEVVGGTISLEGIFYTNSCSITPESSPILFGGTNYMEFLITNIGPLESTPNPKPLGLSYT